MLNLNELVCPKCKESKEEKEFGKDSRKTSGVSSWCKLCKKSWRQQWRKNNPEKAKEQDFKNDLKKHYNMSVEEYYKMVKDQNNCCACCGQSAENFKRGLHVDHDHVTKQIRALLCTECNPGIGYFKESIVRLEMAIAYLKKFKK